MSENIVVILIIILLAHSGVIAGLNGNEMLAIAKATSLVLVWICVLKQRKISYYKEMLQCRDSNQS